jgi:hypothetical protein
MQWRYTLVVLRHLAVKRADEKVIVPPDLRVKEKELKFHF